MITQPQHIALITCDNVFAAGGVGNSIVRLARGLSTFGNVQADVIMFDASEQAPFNPQGRNGITQLDQQIGGVTIFRLNPWTGGTKTAQYWVDMHAALLELTQDRHYDLLHAFYPSITGFPTVYAAQELQLPSVVSIRGNDINRDVFHPDRFHHLKWSLENATSITAVSQEGLQRARIVCAAPAKGRVILNSIIPEDFTEGVQDIQLSRPIIGSLAVFKNKKGIEILLCAFKLLLQHFPTAHLLLVGYVIPEEQSRFTDLLAQYDLADRITITGHVPRQDVLRYLRTMDMFVFSSLHDGCPNAVLEAMLAGLPIVATRSGALPQMIEEGKQGLLVPPGSATTLYNAMLKMLSADTNRQQFGQQARSRVLTQFAPQREVEEYLEVYQDCF
jgi:glycosyltransferase involved in cell wall biosynthesis